MKPPETECARWSIALEGYLDDDLDSAATAALAVHLESCPSCTAELRAAERLRAELRRLPRHRAPAAPVQAALARARAEARASEAGRAGWWSWLQARPAAAALAAVALLVALAIALLPDLRPAPRLTPDDPAVARATLEAKLALAHLTRASREIGREVGGDVLHEHLVTPMARSVAGSLGGRTDIPEPAAGLPAQERG